MHARRLMYLPAAALLAWGVLAAAGVFVTADTRAASSGSTSVTAQVMPQLDIDGTCITGSFSTTSLNVTDGPTPVVQCTVEQDTNNNAAGTTLRVQSSRPASAGFCKTANTAIDCTGTAFLEGTGTAGRGTLGDGYFGVRVNGAPTCSSPTWTNGNFYNLEPASVAPGTGNVICSTVQATPGVYSLSFDADPAGNQEAGTYYASAAFTVEAN